MCQPASQPEKKKRGRKIFPHPLYRTVADKCAKMKSSNDL
jgi:hypothetical protein